MANDERLAIGTLLIERYEIVGHLGRGGFGITYKAQDVENAESFAVKEYLPEFCAYRREDGTVRARDGQEENFAKYLEDFEEEARALSGLDHPHIVKVHNRFEANGTSYFVMDFIEGAPLSAVSREGEPLPTEAVMLIAERLLGALKHIHAQGRVHRDIKPGNIILADAQEAEPSRLPDLPRAIAAQFGNPVLLDFGASRMAPETGKTMTGILTPHFGAPEQSVKRARQDNRTDIYGLGATLYSCLAGEYPPSAIDREREDLLIPAEQRFAKRAPLGFNRAIDRSLQMWPEYRPRTVDDFRDELFGDLQIEGWSRPPAEFDRPGPGLYAGTTGPAVSRIPEPVSVANTAQSVTPVSASAPEPTSIPVSEPQSHLRLALMGAAGATLLAVAGFGFQAVVFSDAGASGSTQAREFEGFNAASNIEVMVRLMQASQSVYNEVKVLEVTRDQFEATGGLSDTIRRTDERIAQLKEKNNADKTSALEIADDLAAYASVDVEKFNEALDTLLTEARNEAKINTTRRLDKIRDLVINSGQSNEISRVDFDTLWSQEVETAQ